MLDNHSRRPVFAALLALSLGLAAGCAETPADLDGPAAGASKLRHGHLMERAYVYAAGKTGGAPDSVRLVIGFGNVTVTAEKVVKRYKIVRRYDYETVFPGVAVSLPADSLQALLDALTYDTDVEWIEPDILVQIQPDPANLFDPGASQVTPWGIGSVDAHNSWARSGDRKDEQGAVDVDVYVLDTGASHPDLNVVECLKIGTGAVMPCGTPDDPNGHGTEVAGVIGALDNERGIVGVAPGARIHAVKVLHADGNADLSSIVAVIDLITRRKLQSPAVPVVVNMSLGAYVGTTAYNALDEAIRKAIQAGVVCVISAGNDGADASLYTPAHVQEAITVGAYDGSRRLAGFSNFGAVVDLHAPGDQVETLSAGNLLIRSSGTSVAAPYVAGGAALYLAKFPQKTPAQVRDRLIALSRDDVDGAPSGTTRRRLIVKDLERP